MATRTGNWAVNIFIINEPSTLLKWFIKQAVGDWNSIPTEQRQHMMMTRDGEHCSPLNHRSQCLISPDADADAETSVFMEKFIP